MGKLYGIDISHHNTDKAVESECLGKHIDFVIHKLTEGKSWRDTEAKRRVYSAIDKGKLVGLYHYARPDNNTPEDEAQNFFDNIPPACLKEECKKNVIYALDWEGNSINYDFSWAIKWCNLVYKKTGRYPLIYASASVVKKYHELYTFWWTAHYNSDCVDGCEHDGGVIEWMTQYKRQPIDLDIFHGTRSDWQNLGIPHKLSNPEPELLYSWEDSAAVYELFRRVKNNG